MGSGAGGGRHSDVGRGDGTKLSSSVGGRGAGVGAKIGDDVGPSVRIDVRSGVENSFWAGDGIGVRLDVKSGIGGGAGNRTAVVWGGVIKCQSQDWAIATLQP